jgi:ATP-dependent DNA helicase DinG
VARRGTGLREALDTYLRQSLSDHVYWIEQEGRRKQMVLYSAPVDVAPLLRQSLFDRSPCVVMTSATLAVRDSMDYLCSRLGADECEALQVGSPFDYARQMRVYLAKGLPDPNDDAGFLDKGTQAVEHFLDRSKGRAFVLFTSARRMKAMAERMRPFMDERGYALLVQDGSLPRHAMLDQFQRGEANVLFGLASFWMGVDVRGEALSNVIITRLPFAVPDHPIVKARMERIREQGGDPFKEYSLPEAVLKFRQGIGRLVRTATDEGMVAILDSRILSKWYGRLFLEALPDCAVEEVEF